MNVAIVYAGNTAAAEETAQGVREAGAQAELLRLRRGGRWRLSARCASASRPRLGPIYALVNNAGITRDKLAAQMKEEDFDAVHGRQPERRISFHSPYIFRFSAPTGRTHRQHLFRRRA